MFFSEPGTYVPRHGRGLRTLLLRGALLLILPAGLWLACTDDTTGPEGSGGSDYLGPSSFMDVSRQHWAHDEIEVLFQEAYVAGCSSQPRRFCPDDAMTRAEAAVFVVRGVNGAGFIPDAPQVQVFDDVPLSEWYAKWVTKLYEDGYTAGCYDNPTSGDFRFCPHDEVNHTEASVFFLRMLHGTEYEPPPASGLFANVSTNFWGAKWLEAAFLANLIPPHLVPDELSPGGLTFVGAEEPATRAEAAYMMYRAKQPEGYDPLTGPTPVTYWTEDETEEKRDIVELARIVRDWLLRFRGERYWNGVFPHEKQMAAWLLIEEIGGCYPNSNNEYQCCFGEVDMGHIARYTRYSFRNGMTANALANFTPFFNPNSGHSFNDADWEELVIPVLNGTVLDRTRHLEIVEQVYSEPFRPPDYYYWWEYCEVKPQYRNDRSWITGAVRETTNMCTSQPFYFTWDYSIRSKVLQDLDSGCE